MRNMNDLVRQAGVMQNKIAKMQQEMAERTVEASSGGGMVKVVATCKQDIKSITIDPKALEGGDVEMLQDLVLAAVNEAIRVGRATMDREVSAITGGIKLPGIIKLKKEDVDWGGGGNPFEKGFPPRPLLQVYFFMAARTFSGRAGRCFTRAPQAL